MQLEHILQAHGLTGKGSGGGSGGGGGYPVNIVKNIAAVGGDTQMLLTWQDPDDVIIDGITVAEWSHTKVVRKIGSPPIHDGDGVLVFSNGVRNAYESTPYIDSGLENDTVYFYSLFPVTTDGVVTVSEASSVSATPKSYRIYGVSIDLENSNPESAVTYIEDAVGMTAGSSDWDNSEIFKDIKPCVLKDGVVQYYLNPMNLAEKEDGTPADITTGADGDVMVEIPKMGVLIETVGEILTVKITANPDNSDFKYYAHTYESGERDNLYIGCYLAWFEGTLMRSLSGKAPQGNTQRHIGRTFAKNKGVGYGILSFYPYTLIQCLFLIKYKTRNSIAWGGGFRSSPPATTGGTNTRGADYGSTNTSQQSCFIHIEDILGSALCFLDGLITTESRELRISRTNNDENYVNHGYARGSDFDGFMKKPIGTTETGFIAWEGGASNTTYFTDYSYIKKNSLAVVGSVTPNTNAGLFTINIYHGVSSVSSDLCHRLMYL